MDNILCRIYLIFVVNEREALTSSKHSNAFVCYGIICKLKDGKCGKNKSTVFMQNEGNISVFRNIWKRSLKYHLKTDF